MSVPVLLTHRAGWGGAEITLLDLIQALEPEKWSVTTAAPPGRFADRFIAMGRPVEIEKFPSWRKGRDLFRNWICSRTMSRLAARLTAKLVIAGDIRTVPYATKAAQANRCPCLAFVQDSTIKERHIKAYRLHHADMTLCPSKRQEEVVVAGGVDPSRVRILYPGIDTKRFFPGVDGSKYRQQWALREDAAIIGCAGSISRLKGQDILLEAALPLIEQNASIQVVLVGSGPESFIDRLKERSGSFIDSGQVRFTGWDENMPAAFAAMDIVVIPSQSESFSRVTAEAMAMGKPVITTQTGAAEALTDNERCGLITPINDTTMLRKKIQYLLDNPGLRHRMAENASIRMEESFSLRQSQLVFNEIITSLC